VVLFDQVDDPEHCVSNRPQGLDSAGELGVPRHAAVLHQGGSDPHLEGRAGLQDHGGELRVGRDPERHGEPTDSF